MIKSNVKISTKKGLNLNSNIQPLISSHSGITLVSLIITIIVMLILVGVSISLAIKGDLFGTAKSGGKQTQIEAYREQLEAIRITAMMEQIRNDLTTEEFMNKVEEGIRTNSTFKESEIKKTAKSVKITTKEGYVFKITENKVTYMGLASEQGELTLDLTEANTDFIYKPSGWTRGQVEVRIETRVDAEELGAILEYSTDGNIWEEYTDKITLTNNGDKIYARLYSEEEEEVGSVVTGTVENVDRLAPKAFIAKGTAEGYTTIKLEGSTTDSEATATDGSGGISRYYYSKDNGTTWEPQNGTQETSYTFENLEDGKTYSELKMKAVDNAGNEFTTNNVISITLPEEPKPHVGDYVDYQPDIVSTPYQLLGKYSGYGAYSGNVLTTPKDQEIKQDQLKWQILKIYNDGSMDLMGTVTSKSVYLQGAIGYNNGVYLLNDICKTLYSKPSKGVEARSVSLEDFEDEENGGKWKAVRDACNFGTGQYGSTHTYTGTNTYYPNLYAREIGAGINTETVNTIGLKQWDKGYDNLTEETVETYSPSETPASDNKLTVTTTAYAVAMNESNYGKAYNVLRGSSHFWVASRYVLPTGYTFFGIFKADATGLGNISGNSIINTTNHFMDASLAFGQQSISSKVRPVVHLSKNCQLELSSSPTVSTNPHKIVNY